MGWYYTAGATKQDIINECTGSWENDKGKCQTIASKVSGRVLWAVKEYTDKVQGGSTRYICCELLDNGGDGWGYKPMDESMGPHYYDCPLAFLDMVPCPGIGFAASWREKVRAYHKERGKK